MKRLILLAFSATCCMGTQAQVVDDFDDFVNSEIASFDKFIDDANKQFISFLRNPWKEFDSEKPVVQRVKPEPVKPVVYDKDKDPVTTPVELTIEEILGQSTRESKQRPQGRVIDGGEKVTFDKPQKPTAKPSRPTEKPSCPNAKPEAPAAKPTCPNAKPEAPATKPEAPTTKPVVVPVTPPATKPSAPTGELFTASSGKQKVNFCGQNVYVDGALKGICSIGNMRENAIADAYESMCKADYQALLDDCRKLKKSLNLNDWGVFLFVREASKALCADENAAVVMQQFLLNELGYKSKMARRADRNQMLLFVAANCQVYGHPYFTKDGLNYYNLTSDDACQFYMCQEDSPKAKNKLNMQLNHAPELNTGMVNTVHKNRSGSVEVAVDVPKSLMEFYNSIPQCDFSVYVNAEVNPSVSNKVLSTLAPLVNGKGEAEAANLLINFVQTGFKYATDQEQFGYEKPFFVEELFYYPYCDCEDRAVLYSYLVRHLLKLDVVLLDYPNHIATAVCFNENVSGDFVTVGGKKYVVCDPTYIGASIGKAMPQFKNVAAKVLKY